MRKVLVALLLVAGFLSPITAQAVVSCPSGTISNLQVAGECLATPSTTAGNITAVYSCSDGYTQPNSNHQCVPNPSTYTASQNTIYICNSGDYISGNYYTCAHDYPASSSTSSYSAASSPSCSSGGSWNGSNCVNSATSSTTYSCPNGGTFSAYYGNICITKFSGSFPASSYNATASTSYTCSSGTLSGSSCLMGYTIVYYCPNGGTLNGFSCDTVITIPAYSSTYYATSSTTYSCPNGGSLSGTTCTVSATPYNASVVYSGTCPTYYRLNVITGVCEAYSFSATNVQLIDLWSCVTTYSNGMTVQKQYPYDATLLTDYGTSRKCTPLQIDLAIPVTTTQNGLFYCTIFSFDTLDTTDFISDKDVTSQTSSSITTCQFDSDFTEIDPYSNSPQPSITFNEPCSAITNYSLWLSCLDSSAVSQ